METIVSDKTHHYIILYYQLPQTIKFENNPSLELENVKSLVFDLDNYTLYWGNDMSRINNKVYWMNLDEKQNPIVKT